MSVFPCCLCEYVGIGIGYVLFRHFSLFNVLFGKSREFQWDYSSNDYILIKSWSLNISGNRLSTIYWCVDSWTDVSLSSGRLPRYTFLQSLLPGRHTGIKNKCHTCVFPLFYACERRLNFVEIY